MFIQEQYCHLQDSENAPEKRTVGTFTLPTTTKVVETKHYMMVYWWFAMVEGKKKSP